MSVEIIDAQVHIWEADHPGRPWIKRPPPKTTEPSPFIDQTLESVTDEDLIQAMDDVGVDAALIVTPSRMYGADNSFSFEAMARRPDRFGLVGRFDHTAPDVEELVAQWREQPGALGLRFTTSNDTGRAQLREGQFDRALAAAEAHQVPMCIYPVKTLPEVVGIAERFPELQIVIDHVGLAQRPLADIDPDPFQRLPELLALARYPNVAVKLSAVPTLSYLPFPYEDVWPHVHRVIEAFGLERVMWGTDWARSEPIANYRQSLEWLTNAGELSADDLESVLGKTLRRIFRWERSTASAAA